MPVRSTSGRAVNRDVTPTKVKKLEPGGDLLVRFGFVGRGFVGIALEIAESERGNKAGEFDDELHR